MTLQWHDFVTAENTVQTAQIQALIDAADAQGISCITVPKGNWVSGTLNLRSVSLYLERGAILNGSPNADDYCANGFIHNEMKQTISLLYSMHSDGVSITGEGVIDFHADAFYDMALPNDDDAQKSYTDAQRDECPRKILFRPTQPIFFADCTNIRISGITLRHSPCWTVTFHNCDGIRVTDVTIANDMNIPNCDGIHLCGSRNAVIRGCNIVSGDDCIALSGITDWDLPCEQVVISDCILKSCSKALSIGYMHSIVRNVTVSNCIIYDTQRGISLMASKGTGLVEHILFSNLRIETHIRAGAWWGNGEPIYLLGCFHHYESYLRPLPKRDFTVSIRDIHFENISCSAENRIGIVGSGKNIRDIYFNHVTLELLPSQSRYLKGERAIDTDPAKEQCIIPDGYTGGIVARDAMNIQVNGTVLKEDFYEKRKNTHCGIVAGSCCIRNDRL